MRSQLLAAPYAGGVGDDGHLGVRAAPNVHQKAENDYPDHQGENREAFEWGQYNDADCDGQPSQPLGQTGPAQDCQAGNYREAEETRGIDEDT